LRQPAARQLDRTTITFDRLAVGCVFVAAGVLACLAPAQGDTWWHLRAGLDIWRTHHVSLVDTYSYTAAGAVFPDHSWLADALFYRLYAIGGMALVATACAAAIVGAWLIAWTTADGPFEVALVALVAGIVASTISWALRPQVLSMAALAIVVRLVVSRHRRLIPIVFLVWANVHGAVAIGLVVMGAACLAEAIDTRRLPIALGVVTAACVATTFVTPLGMRFWPEVLASLERSKANALVEWSMPDGRAVFWPFWAMAVMLPVMAAIYRRRLHGRTLMLVVIALALLPLAMRSMRNVAMFALVATPAIVTLARDEKIQINRTSPERGRLNAALLGGAIAIGVGIVALAWRADAPMLGWHPLEPAAIAAIDANAANDACPEPIYNTFEDGGALIWFVPDKPVFIDNRQDPYSTELLTAAHRVESDGDYAALFAQFGIHCAVVPSASPTSQRLRGDPAWRPTYGSARWSVFVRR
jgi:hypothetical protein